MRLVKMGWSSECFVGMASMAWEETTVVGVE